MLSLGLALWLIFILFQHFKEVDALLSNLYDFWREGGWYSVSSSSLVINVIFLLLLSRFYYAEPSDGFLWFYPVWFTELNEYKCMSSIQFWKFSDIMFSICFSNYFFSFIFLYNIALLIGFLKISHRSLSICWFIVFNLCSPNCVILIILSSFTLPPLLAPFCWDSPVNLLLKSVYLNLKFIVSYF